MNDRQKAVPHIDAPKFFYGMVVQINGSRYSFRIDEVILEKDRSYRYRGQMFKDGKPYSYGTASERALIGH